MMMAPFDNLFQDSLIDLEYQLAFDLVEMVRGRRHTLGIGIGSEKF